MEYFKPTDVRACPKCARPIPGDARTCPYCYLSVEPRPARVAAPVAAVPATGEAGARLVTRHRDAYSIANGIGARGESVKATARMLGCVIVLLCVFAGFQVGDKAVVGGLLIGVFLGVVVWAAIDAMGVHLCAEGQMLFATLDTAVNTSPSLSETQRLEAMSL